MTNIERLDDYIQEQSRKLMTSREEAYRLILLSTLIGIERQLSGIGGRLNEIDITLSRLEEQCKRSYP